MTKTTVSKGIRVLAAAVLALFAFSCQVPESERTPEILEIFPSATNPSALESSITVQVKCDLHWTAELQDNSWGSVKVTLVTEGSGGTFTFNMGVNKSEDSRENTLIVKAGKGEIRKTITQGGIGSFFSPRSLTLTGTQEGAVTFTSPVAWTAQVAEGADWLELKAASGSKGSNRIIAVAKDANENVGSRSGSIRISFENDSFDIPVVQGQTDVILTKDSAVSFPFEAQEFSVTTQYNVEYKVETSASWITQPVAKAPLHEKTEYFVLAENPDPQTRTGEIRFTGGDAKPLVLTVTQEGKDPILNVTQPGFYGIDGSNYVLAADGWNQRTRQVSPDRKVRYRLLNTAGVSVAEVSGINEEAQKGESASLHMTLKTKGKMKVFKDYQAVFFYEKEDLLWYKADDVTYFVLYK